MEILSRYGMKKEEQGSKKMEQEEASLEKTPSPYQEIPAEHPLHSPQGRKEKRSEE
jgi:hypothetical protein